MTAQGLRLAQHDLIVVALQLPAAILQVAADGLHFIGKDHVAGLLPPETKDEMVTSLLQTKLYIPPRPEDLVSHPRLIERLNTGLGRKLTLISAPAGFGKTTLLSEWVADYGRPVVRRSRTKATTT
jgi:hypothetical protein